MSTLLGRVVTRIYYPGSVELSSLPMRMRYWAELPPKTYPPEGKMNLVLPLNVEEPLLDGGKCSKSELRFNGIWLF